MLNGKSSIENVKFVKPYSIIHGNESKGLDEKFLEVGESSSYSHSKSIDFLNLSIAAGISIGGNQRVKYSIICMFFKSLGTSGFRQKSVSTVITNRFKFVKLKHR